jgi:hypothetical protein
MFLFGLYEVGFSIFTYEETECPCVILRRLDLDNIEKWFGGLIEGKVQAWIPGNRSASAEAHVRGSPSQRE